MKIKEQIAALPDDSRATLQSPYHEWPARFGAWGVNASDLKALNDSHTRLIVLLQQMPDDYSSAQFVQKWRESVTEAIEEAEKL